MTRIDTLRRRAVAIVLALLVTAPTHADSLISEPLARWIATEAAQELADTLTRHPRFKGESIYFQQPSNALEAAVEARLSEHLVGHQGVRLRWDDGAGFCAVGPTANYRIHLDFRRSGGQYRLNLRIIDVQEQLWVGGVSLAWQGRLSRAQRAALDASPPADRHAAPIPADPVRIADALAAQLQCRLPAGPAATVRIDAEPGLPVDIAHLRARLATLGWRLADDARVRLSVDADEGADRLQVRARLTGPGQSATQLASVTASPSRTLLSGLQFRAADGDGICRRASRCTEVAFTLHEDAYLVIFSTTDGKVRSLACQASNVTTSGERRYRLKLASSREPTAGFYVLASGDKATARRLASVVNSAPGACPGTIADRNWLQRLDAELANNPQVAWEAAHLTHDEHGLARL